MPKNLLLFLYGPKKTVDEVVKNIKQAGYYMYEGKLSKDEVQQLREECLDLLSTEEVDVSGQTKGRVYKQGSLSQLVSKYINNYKSIAVNYFNDNNVECELSMYQKSLPEKSLDNVPGGVFHMDDNKKNLKFFIYLSDVNLDNGPFMYVPNTHGINSIKKMIKWWFWEVFLLRKYLYVTEAENERLKKLSVPITGDCGTVFCADTTGYHAASTVISGERLVLVISFAEKRLDPYAFLSNSHSY